MAVTPVSTTKGAKELSDLAERRSMPRSVAGQQLENREQADAWLRVLSAIDSVSWWRLFYTTVAKRTLDVTAACVLLVTLSPLLLVAMLAIRTETTGGALFRQTRVGRGGSRFTLYKFRTMTQFPSREVVWFVDEHGRRHHKRHDDPRITKVGRWLRRSSIDELPQLVNVIKGEMSLIGPRPELPEIVGQYEPWQHDRHLVRPGLTGWWQVSGRSDLPMHEHTELDLFYVRRQSFRLDFLIAIKTIRVVVKGLGAF